MGNNYLKSLFTLLLLLCSIVVSAHDFEVDGIYYNILSQEDKTVEVTYNGIDFNDYYLGNVVIPASVSYKNELYSVVSIGGRAFEDCTGLTSIKIPNSVTSIGERAFSGCSGLTSIEIPNSVTSIGDYAFYYCTGLTSITIPNSVTSIGKYAFSGCAGLTSIEIPNSVTSIGEYAFSGCRGLTSIEIPNSLTSIGEYAFSGCSKLAAINVAIDNEKYKSVGGAVYTKDMSTIVVCPAAAKGSFSILDGVTSIGDFAFSGCSSLTSIEIPNSVTSIGDFAFSGCSSLTSIEIPNSVTSIGDYAFSDCSGLTSIEIPNGVTSIGERAFYGCRSLTSIEIPNSVTSIGESAFENTAWYKNQSDCVIYIGKILYKYKGKMPGNTYIKIKEGTVSIYPSAFSGCSGLTSIEIPNSVTSIGDYAFSDCRGLTSIKIPNSVTSIGERVFSGCSSLTSIVLSNSVTSIGDFTFCLCRGLTSIEIPNSVTSIGEYAFSGCRGLTSIEIPNSVTSIGGGAFFSCDKLAVINVAANNEKYKSVGGVVYTKDMSTIVVCSPAAKGSFSIPDGVTSIGDYAFSDCRGLTNIVIPNSVTSIGDYAFYYCSSLTSIEIPNSVTSIGDYAFSDCNSLTSITIPNSVTSIGDHAFFRCSSLTSIEIPNSVTSIGEYAFSYCSGLTSIAIPNSVTSIGNGAFYDCNSLTSIAIPNSVTSIGEYAFSYSEGLTSIEIPNSVTSIGDHTFSSCSGLTSIEIPNSVTSIGNSAFSGCSGLTSITIPNSVTSIGKYAFENCSGLTSIEIPNSVTSIGYSAFSGCSSLTSIVIPSNVITIGSYAFKGCSSLTKITSHIPANELFKLRDDTFGNVDKTACTLYVPYGAKNKYATTAGWKDFKNIVEIRNTYKATFIVDDKEFATVSILEGDTITYPEVPEKDGYILKWEPALEIMPSNDITIIGRYVVNKYLLTYKVDGAVYASDSIDYGATIEPIAEPAKEGHTFSGWSDIPATMPAEDVIIEGNFTVNKYLLTYKVDGAVYASDSIDYGATIEPIAEPAKVGHTFSGWSDIPDTMPAEDVVIEGNFTVNKYLLTYKVDDEVYASDSIDYGAIIEPIAEPTKEGHTFSGWSDIPATMPAEDVVVEGSFSVNKYLLTYKVDDEVYASDSIDYGATIEPIAEPAKEGHTFSGWSDIPDTMPAEDVIVEGSFSINKYLLTYKVDGAVYASDSIDYGATIEPIAEPAKVGHTFSGWSDIPATMPAEDVVIEGNFSVNKYLLTYKVDGAVYASDSIDYGATIEPIEAPTKVGHTFSGWSDIPATMPAEDVVVEGSFSINSYTVTFMVDGEVYETITVEYGATIEPIEAPTKVGHTFKGWSDIPATMPAEDIVVEANFAVNSYAVILMIDGNLYKIITVEYGAEIELPTPPEKEGYVFTGWIDVPATMPAEDIIIEGSYKVNTGISAVGLDLEKNEVYNLKGQRVTESENLTRGIYIVNGKKVYVK